MLPVGNFRPPPAQLAHRFDVLAGNLHRGAGPDVVQAYQEEGLGFFFFGAPVRPQMICCGPGRCRSRSWTAPGLRRGG